MSVGRWWRKLRFLGMRKEMILATQRYIGRSLGAALFVCAFFFTSISTEAQNFTTPLIVSKSDGSNLGFDVELAISDEQRSKGLMYRTELAPDKGMLFIFKDDRPRRFWMRNTYIPLDIIFLRPDGSIINIVANAEPRTETGRFSSGPAKAVLEIPGGRAEELGIKAGDIVRHALLGNMTASGSTGR